MTFALSVLLPGLVTAQTDDLERRSQQAIGEIISVGAVLSATDLVGGGRFDLKDGLGSFRLRHLGGKYRFREGSRLQPWVRGVLGRAEFEQQVDLFGVPYDQASLDAKSLLIGGGFDYDLGRGWYVQPEAGVVYSRISDRLDYRNPLSEVFRPVIDGRFYNWDAEALTILASVRLGYRVDWSNGFGLDVAGQVEALATGPVSTEDVLQDGSTHSNVSRLEARANLPLGIAIRDWGLNVVPRGGYVRWGSEIAEPLGSDSMTTLGLRLVAEPKEIGPDRKWWMPKAVGVGVTRTMAAEFSGWSFGVTLRAWASGW